MNIQLKIRFGFIISLTFLPMAGFSSYLLTQQLINTSAWVSHTYNVITLLESVISQLDDAETGQRGYILTANSKYLEPYVSGRNKIDSILKEVKKITSDNPEQQARIDLIELMTKKKLQELEETILLYNKGGRPAAIKIIMTDRGKIIMDKIRSIIDDMKSMEASLLEFREAESASAVRPATLVTLFGSLLAFFIISIVAFYVGRETKNYIRERDQAELKHGITINKLEQSLLDIKTLKGIIPICSYCKGIRNDKGAYQKLEAYISTHSDVQFSHGVCPDCKQKVLDELHSQQR